MLVVELLRHHEATNLNPQVDTLIKYLVDSLQSYETDYSDALCPIPTEADKSFMGDHILVQPVTTNEFQMFSTAIFSMLQSANSFVPHPTTLTRGPPINSFMAPEMLPASAATANVTDPWFHAQQTAPCPTELVHNVNTNPVDSLSVSADLTHLTPDSDTNMDRTFREATNLPRMDINIPDLPRSKGTWEQAIAQWFEIDPTTGIALKDWPEEWYTGPMRRKTGSKRSHRALIAGEYQR